MPGGRRRKFRKNTFIDDEAEHSGDEIGDENNEADGEDAYDTQDPFIDDGNIQYESPPLEEMQIEKEVREKVFPDFDEPDQHQIDEYLAPKPPPPAHSINRQGPPAPPPAKPGAPAPPAAKPPAKKQAALSFMGADWIRPKTDRDKRMCQIAQQGLMPSVKEGYLLHVLVTVIPDPHEKLEDAWKHVEDRHKLLVAAAKELPGVFAIIIAIETHGAAGDKKKGKRKNPNTQDAAHQAEQQGQDAEAPALPSKKDTLAGKPHFHVLLYYPKLTADIYNLSHYKKIIMTKLPKSDVNEKHLPDHHTEPDFVRTFTYCLKGVNCKATKTYWQRHVNPATSPPLPAFYPGPHFGFDEHRDEVTKSESKRFLSLLSQLTTWCESNVPLKHADAPPSFCRAIKRSKQSQASYVLAEIMKKLGIFVGGREDNQFYVLSSQEGYTVTNSYDYKYDIREFKREISKMPQGNELVIDYGESMERWLVSSQLPHIPKLNWEWVELKDSFYNVRSGEYVMRGEPFTTLCFRAYSYTKNELETTEPVEWLAMLDTICAKRLIYSINDKNSPNGKREVYSQGIEKDILLLNFALLFRKRSPKQKILFLWGESNCGKSTITSFLKQLYPVHAIGFVNKSCVALSGVNEDVAVIIGDEFDITSIPRADLLTLTDGSQLLTIRTMHQDARQINNPLCPIIFTHNHAPKYKDDTTQALQNRLLMVHCENTFVPDHAKQQLVFKEHLLIAAHLNRYLAKQKH
jgi:hypothetical protein